MPSVTKLDEIHESMLVRNERKLEREINSFFIALTALMLKLAEEYDLNVSRAEIEKAQPDLENLLEKAYVRAGGDGVKLAEKMLPEDDFSEEAALLALLFWAKLEAKNISKIITETTKNYFDEVVEKFTVNGKLEALPKKIIREFKKKNKPRNKIIGTTESNKAIQQGEIEAAQEMERKQPFDIYKTWRSQQDLRVRDTHVRADKRYSREPIPVRAMFQVGRGFGLYPLASTLPYEEVVQCRCYLILRKVNKK